MRQGSEVRWILLACAVLNCLVILLSVGEYRGMVSDGIYDALISAGQTPIFSWRACGAISSAG